jgi:hypothetical protein
MSTWKKVIEIDTVTGRRFYISKGGFKSYMCKFDGCMNKQRQDDSCAKHGAKSPRCKFDGCNNGIRNNKLCARHGAVKPIRPKCKFDGCKNDVQNKGHCFNHGASRSKSQYCKTCELKLLSNNRMQLGIKECQDCYTRGKDINDKPRRLELQWLEKLEKWNYFPNVHDKVIKDNECNVTNIRRVDFMFITDSDFPCHVLVECDEFSHGHIPLDCEMKRLQDVHDQIISNTCRIKPLLVIRFNPNNADTEMIEKELKKSLNEIFIHKNFVLGDARGVNIYSIIGYGTKRTYLYDSEEIVKKIKV